MSDDPDVLAQAAAAGALADGGATVREIADQLGCSVGTAHNRLRLYRDAERVARDSDDRRAGRLREVAALDAWQATAQNAYDDAPSPEWLRALVALSARRSRLLGLDAPARIRIGDDDRTPPEPSPDVVAAIDAVRAQNAAVRERAQRDVGDQGDD